MIYSRMLVGTLVFALLGCVSSTKHFSREGTEKVVEKFETIGVATMDASETLFLQLRAESEDGAVGDAMLVYKKGDPEYQEVLAHVGPIRPGETVSVRPWSNNP